MILIVTWADLLHAVVTVLVYGALFLFLFFLFCALVSSTIDSTIKAFYTVRREASAVSYAMMQQLARKEKEEGHANN